MVFQYAPLSGPLNVGTGGWLTLFFSPKSFPWFVSDVTPPDFSYTIRALQQPELWASKPDSDEGQGGASASDTTSSRAGALEELARRFQERVQTGQFELSVGLDTPLGVVSTLLMKRKER